MARSLTFTTQPGLRIVVSERDGDDVLIDVFAASRRFAGATTVYPGPDGLRNFAAQLRGFPCGQEDVRVVELGDEISESGYCMLRFCCLDEAGHCALDIEIRESKIHGDTDARARMRITPFVAGDVDEFVRELDMIRPMDGGVATLSVV